MTGVKDHNFPAFDAAAKHIRTRGHDVINPAEFEPAFPDMTWEDFLRRDLKYLLECEAVAVLPGWEKSKGASLEAHVAQALGMPVLDAETLEPLNGGKLHPTAEVVP